MSIPLIAQITRKNNAAFALFDAVDGRGGYRSVADHATRDAIVSDMRFQGMLVLTNNDGFYWSLGSDLVTWTQALLGALPATTGNVTLAVSTTGNDSQGPYTSGDQSATPFLTIQGALNALPIFNNHNIIINVGAGTFPRFVPPSIAGGGTFRIIGSVGPSTLTTGPNSGTCGAGTSVDGNGFFHVNQPTGAVNWTAGNLRGKHFVITGGTGYPGGGSNYAQGVIVSNTATSLIVNMCFTPGNLVGVQVATIDTTTQFQIVDNTTIIDPTVSTTTYYMTAQSTQNLFQLERFVLGGGGAYRATLLASQCSYFVVLCCTFNTAGTSHLRGLDTQGGGRIVMWGCYFNAADAAINIQESAQAFFWGNVQDGGDGWTVTASPSASGLNNDIANSRHYGCYVHRCPDFAEYTSNFNGLGNSAYQVIGSQQAVISGVTVAGTVSGYGIEVGPQSFVTNDSKALTGALGNFLLDDVVGSYGSCVKNDEFIRQTAQLQYVGP